MNPVIDSVRKTFDECMRIVEKKNQDYGGDDPYKNLVVSQAFGINPEQAILVRILDKISRLSNLLEKDPAVVEESFEDTCHDLINYGALLKAVRQRDHRPNAGTSD